MAERVGEAAGVEVVEGTIPVASEQERSAEQTAVKKIVVAEDDRFFATFLGVLCKKAGFEVIPVESAQKAEEVMQAAQPGEIRLAFSDGLKHEEREYRRVIRAANTAHIDAVLITGTEEFGDEVTRNGTAYYIPKPEPGKIGKEFLDKINEVLYRAPMPESMPSPQGEQA